MHNLHNPSKIYALLHNVLSESSCRTLSLADYVSCHLKCKRLVSWVFRNQRT